MALISWFRENGRDLPWRRTRDPWRILVSEVMTSPPCSWTMRRAVLWRLTTRL